MPPFMQLLEVTESTFNLSSARLGLPHTSTDAETDPYSTIPSFIVIYITSIPLPLLRINYLCTILQ
jgi:hypothetical protein